VTGHSTSFDAGIRDRPREKSVVTICPDATRTDVPLLEAARVLRPPIEASADHIERERRLPESLGEAMAAAGRFTTARDRRRRDIQVGAQNVAVSPMGYGAAGQRLLSAGGQ
jgi:hypothetical protein